MSKIKCNCPCHHDSNFKHIQACCVNGYVEMPDFTPSPKDQPEGPYTLRWVSKTPDDGSENIVVRRKGSPYRAVVDRVGVALKDGYENTWGYVTDSEIEYLEETSSPAVKPDLLSEMRDKAIRDGFDDLCINHGPYKGECIECAREETRQMASETGMSQEAFDGQTKPKEGYCKIHDRLYWGTCLACNPGICTNEPAPTAQGEIPEEIKIEKFIIHCLNKFSWTDSAYKNAHRSMIDLYHKMQEEIRDYKEVLADKAHYTRKLDIIWNGEEGAAKQAALIDIVGQIEDELPNMREEIQEYRKAIEGLNTEIDKYWNGDKSDSQVNMINSAQRKCFNLLKIKYPNS